MASWKELKELPEEAERIGAIERALREGRVTLRVSAYIVGKLKLECETCIKMTADEFAAATALHPVVLQGIRTHASGTLTTFLPDGWRGSEKSKMEIYDSPDPIIVIDPLSSHIRRPFSERNL
jgi:hypothetical protein